MSNITRLVLLDGRHYPVPFDTIARLTQSGWDFHQDIIWHKCTAGVKRAGVTIQIPYPGYYYPNIMTEYILIFRKPGPPIYHQRTAEEKAKAKYPINRLFTMDITNNIWHIAPVPPNILDQPAPFPEEIPYRLIPIYSYPGEIILDPFLGSGQTSKVARWLHRQYVGYEIVSKYIELAQKRLAEPLLVRPEQLVAIFDKVRLEEESNSGGKSTRRPRKRGSKMEKERALPLFDSRLLEEK